MKLFQTRYCFAPDQETNDPFAFRCIPVTNDFSDFTEYFLKKVRSRLAFLLAPTDTCAQTLLTAISMVRDEHGQTPPVVKQFLIDLLAYNDNLSNAYSDTFYITAIISAFSHALVSTAPTEISQFSKETQTAGLPGHEELPLAIRDACEEVNRYMSTDRLVPSYHNAITVSGIEVRRFSHSLNFAHRISSSGKSSS